MILADKIINLRKKSGMSQEELAEMMHVSRQSVSKWEGAQAVPDLNKIIKLSQIFGVSTDFLLKDELEMEKEVPEYAAEEADRNEEAAPRHVSMEEANEFLHKNENWAGKTAFGVALCILSPVVLLLLAGMSEIAEYAVPENVAAGMGMIVLLLMIAAAVSIFVMGGIRLDKFEFLESELLETDYGVAGMAKERKDRYSDIHTRELIIGIVLCILSAIPLFAVLMRSEEDFMAVVGVVLLLFLVAFGVFFLTKTSIIWSGYQKLLEEGDYERETKAEKRKTRKIRQVYWLVVTAAFLAYSLLTNDWGRSWIIWPVAVVLCMPVMEIIKWFRSSTVSSVS